MPTATVQISDNRLRDLLCSAIEGGSNYWYTITEYRFPEGTTYDDFREGGKHTLDEYWHPCELIPFFDGCGLVFGDVEAEDPNDEDEAAFKPTLLNKEALDRGIQVMSEKYPRHFANVIEENDDAETGDVFLQCCLFGEIVFG